MGWEGTYRYVIQEGRREQMERGKVLGQECETEWAHSFTVILVMDCVVQYYDGVES